MNATTMELTDSINETRQKISQAERETSAEASKWEVLSYYLYGMGGNQFTLTAFAPVILQYLLALQAGDAGLLSFAGADRNINTIILYCSGIAFGFQVVLCLLLGSLADYGTWRPWILIIWTIVGWATGFAWMGLLDPEKWPIAAGIYIVGSVAISLIYNFWIAAFPRLARSVKVVRDSAERLSRGEITQKDFDAVAAGQRVRVMNTSLIASNFSGVVFLAIAIGILYAIRANDSIENNLRGFGICTVYLTAIWVVLAIPWFVLEKRRPGQKLPAGISPFLVGFWQSWQAFKQVWKLRQSFTYLLAYILLGDTYATSYYLTLTLRNEIIGYDSFTVVYQIMIQSGSLSLGTYTFWYIQKKFNLASKTLVDVSIFSIIIVCGWGMIGIWTDKFGYHNAWEFWVYQVIAGFFVSPCLSYCNVLMAELTPHGKEFLFFSLFNAVSLASSFIGPFISGGIIDADTKPDKPGNNYLPFYFLFGVSVLCFFLVYFFVDVEKSKVEQVIFLLEEEKKERARQQAKGGSYLERAEDTNAAVGTGDMEKKQGNVTAEEATTSPYHKA